MVMFVRREYIGDIRLNSDVNDGKVTPVNATGGFTHTGNLQYAFVPEVDKMQPTVNKYYYQYKYALGDFTGEAYAGAQPPATSPPYVPYKVDFANDNSTQNVIVNNTYVVDGKPSGSLLVNPGNNALFPWLSRVAKSYEQYRINYLEIEYVPLISQSNSQTALVGSVLLGYNPNASDKDFQTKAEFLEHSNTVTSKSNAGFKYRVPLNTAWKDLYVDKAINLSDFYSSNRADNVFQDPKTLYMGSLSFGTQGFIGGQPGQQLGQVFVSYDIELRKERMPEGTRSLY